MRVIRLRPASAKIERVDERSGSPDVPVPLVREELNRILASETFSRSGRLCRFLRFTVESTLEGHGKELKEYPVAIEVFDRDPSFDPKNDTIVRVEARRLRNKLEDYYKTRGRDNPVRIRFDKGSYAPHFVIPQLPVRQTGIRLLIFAALAVTLALAGAAAYKLIVNRAAEPVGDANTIAVLPFVNLGPDAETEYFADGLVEELTTALSKVSGLRVVARTSAYQFKGKQFDAGQIGRRLAVASLMEGSVRRSGDQLRISVQLIRVSDAHHIWSEVYQRDLHDVFKVQREIAVEVARVLKLRIGSREYPAEARLSAPTAEAYDLYIKGSYFRRQMSGEGLKKSIDLFEQATLKDPTFAPAFAALADAYAMSGFHGLSPIDEAVSKAKGSAGKALKLDPTNAKAHGALGWIGFFYDRDWPLCEREFQRAIELDPEWSSVRQWHAFALTARGRFGQAIAESQKAADLEPLFYVVSGDLAVIHYYARHFEVSLRLARQTLDLNPDNPLMHEPIGMCLVMMGRFGEAIAEFLKVPVPDRRYSAVTGRLGHAYAVAGNKAEARSLLMQLEQDSAREHTTRYTEMAYVQLGLGDLEQACNLLEKAYARREVELAFLRVEPILEPLQPSPRFKALVERVTPSADAETSPAGAGNQRGGARAGNGS